jgi:hypothetical protein
VALATFTRTNARMGASVAEVAVIVISQGKGIEQSGIPITLTWRVTFPMPEYGDAVK